MRLESPVSTTGTSDARSAAAWVVNRSVALSFPVMPPLPAHLPGKYLYNGHVYTLFEVSGKERFHCYCRFQITLYLRAFQF